MGNGARVNHPPELDHPGSCFVGDTLGLSFDTTTQMESPVFVLTSSTERVTIGHIKEGFERKVVADILNSAPIDILVTCKTESSREFISSAIKGFYISI